MSHHQPVNALILEHMGGQERDSHLTNLSVRSG